LVTNRRRCYASPPFEFSTPTREKAAVTRTNILYLVIGALAIAVVVLGYQLYQDRHQPQGVHIDFGPNGLSIHGK
jgi:hypothetical protein